MSEHQHYSPRKAFSHALSPSVQPQKQIHRAGPSKALKVLERLLAQAHIQVNGENPWDIKIHNPKMAERVLAQGNLGLGESYMDAAWDVDQLDEFFCRILRHGLDQKVRPTFLVLHSLRAKLWNLQNLRRAWQVGQVHYDLGNDFYAAMLDPNMSYSCGYWQQSETLASAQTAKLDLICRKLALQPGMRLLDIGCGWGSLMHHAASHYGVECVGLTISAQQAEGARQLCTGLHVNVRLQDYRALQSKEKFDRIASVGMLEHVGQKNYRRYLQAADRHLREDGLFLLHTIGKNCTQTHANPWIDKYIFPNGSIPALKELAAGIEDLFVMEDVHNLGPDYDQTLLAWHRNFESNWPLFASRYDQRFYRMWRYYLLSCAGAFRARDLQLWQIVLSKGSRAMAYRRPELAT
jgi:cyclopropane-fatty-acyl-phospholipid synthase